MTRRSLAADLLAGADIPADALVILSTYALHRHPGVWGRPGAFRPRPLRARSAGGGRRDDAVRRAYLPFGAGPRLCIGRDFALVEATLLLSQLAGEYRLERLPGQTVRADALVTIRPRGGLPLRLRRRGLGQPAAAPEVTPELVAPPDGAT